MKNQWLISLMAVALSWSVGTAAQESKYDLTSMDNDAPSRDDIIKALTPKPPLVSRSLDGEPPPPMKLRAIPLRIQFELDSYELTDKAQETLNNLGAALMSDALSTYRFRIEGHTDASGQEAYNMDLSKRRADGVRNYLISIFEMESERLESVGRGEGSLLNPDNPNSAENRVVLIVNLGPGEG
ncbi:MAG: OmpA family protein [Xanthomonadales bacterium]|nr:OmpA family protein [Xanthomonadales bacterium]